MNDQCDPPSTTTPLNNDEAECERARDCAPDGVLDEAAWLALLNQIDQAEDGP